MPAYCGYIRVSDDKLKTDGSRRQDIERQKEVLQPLMDEFKANNPEYEFAGWFSDDGKSAWTDDLNSRPAFAKMTNLVRANRLHWVFLEDLTRFSRNLGQGLVWLQEYAKKGCTVTSLHFGEHEVTSIKGWFLCNQLLMMAELESRLRSEKVTSGMINRLNKETGVLVYFHDNRINNSENIFNLLLAKGNYKAERFTISNETASKKVCPVMNTNSFSYKFSRGIQRIFN